MSPPPSRPNSLGKQNEATALAVKSSEKVHVMGIQGSKPLRMEKLPSEKNGKHAVNTSTSGSSGSTFPQLNGATAAGTGPGTKCHLCQKVLSRRDKLKWHLAICCPRFHVDLYDQLLVAGFAHAIAKVTNQHSLHETTIKVSWCPLTNLEQPVFISFFYIN